MVFTDKKQTKQSNKLLFDDVKCGQLFMEEGSDVIYIKLYTVVIDKEYRENEYNAVSLRSGTSVHFESDEKVGVFIDEPEIIYNSDNMKWYK